MALLNVLTGLVEVGGHVVQVQLDGSGPCTGEFPGVTGPASRGDAVEGGHHRYVEYLGQAPDVAQHGVGAAGEDIGLGEKRRGFCVGVDHGVEVPVGRNLIGDQLLLEQRVHHHRACAHVDQGDSVVRRVAQRRCTDHERVGQPQPKPVTTQLNHRCPPVLGPPLPGT